ncbi:hypothetical protein EDB83DRAFT_2379328 [Lactarius deliciosus]|nr:hypothetical protein EDB83DRAFT_2379328 [Lactarius deliciosus]
MVFVVVTVSGLARSASLLGEGTNTPLQYSKVQEAGSGVQTTAASCNPVITSAFLIENGTNASGPILGHVSCFYDVAVLFFWIHLYPGW